VPERRARMMSRRDEAWRGVYVYVCVTARIIVCCSPPIFKLCFDVAV
jgi:hypothetical protein